MGIPDVAQRRYLFEKGQQYLFSYDVNFVHTVEIVTEGNLRHRLLAKNEDDRSEDVFHVLDDRRVLGNDAITGTLRSLEETIDVTKNGESALSSGRMLIKVGDGVILGTWDGVVRVGPRHFNRFVVSGEEPPADAVDVPAQMTCRFQSPNQKYKWLTEQLCMGFGSFKMRQGTFVSATFDIYGIA